MEVVAIWIAIAVRVALAFTKPASVASNLKARFSPQLGKDFQNEYNSLGILARISHVQNQNVVHTELVRQGNVLLQNLITETFYGLDI
jgi:hypothetical protein